VISFKVTSNLEKVRAELVRRFGDDFTQKVLLAAEVAASAIRKEVADWTGKTSARKTGALARSFKPMIVTETENVAGLGVKLSGVAAGAYSNLKYAAIHEEGGPITAKGGALTIPITPQAQRRRARDWGDQLVLIRKPGHLPILASKEGDRIKPQYILKKRVYISGKGYIAKAAEASRDEVEAIIRDGVQASIDDAGAGPKKT
jgi:hypothetical protein